MLFDHDSFRGHESVSYFQDETTGLKALIAVHSTALGPAAGGCRMWPYASDEEALRDVLRLSRGMSYKNAMAGLPFGGGKSVIISDSRKHKSEALLRAFGRSVQSLGKGSDRPIVPEQARARVVAAVGAVDRVVLFDEPTPAVVIARLAPDVLVKGGDYQADQVVGAEETIARGGRVVIVPLVPGHSTTRIAEKLRDPSR